MIRAWWCRFVEEWLELWRGFIAWRSRIGTLWLVADLLMVTLGFVFLGYARGVKDGARQMIVAEWARQQFDAGFMQGYFMGRRAK